MADMSRNLRSVRAATGSTRPFLDAIVAAAGRRAERLRKATTFDSLLNRGRDFRRRSLADTIRSRCGPSIIGEIKKASPSKGVFRSDFDPLRLAGSYVDGAVAAISVVTEPEFFQGQGEWIAAIRQAAPCAILRKDFIVDPIQVAESAALGADGVLLIARILTPIQLCALRDAAAEASLEVLFEAHDEDDLRKISAVAPLLVGVNARNLDDFSVDPALLSTMRAQMPPDAIAVAESGIESPRQVASLARMGYKGFLVGEALLRAGDPAGMIRRLSAGINDHV